MERIETEYGYKEVYTNGDIYHHNRQDELHNPNGPAVEEDDGSKEYWVNGELHRTDGPAVEWSNGYNEYWVNGELHNPNGPAVEYSDGSKFYYKHGKLHNHQGFAVITKNHKLNFLNGKYVWKK